MDAVMGDRLSGGSLFQHILCVDVCYFVVGKFQNGLPDHFAHAAKDGNPVDEVLCSRKEKRLDQQYF